MSKDRDTMAIVNSFLNDDQSSLNNNVNPGSVSSDSSYDEDDISMNEEPIDYGSQLILDHQNNSNHSLSNSKRLSKSDAVSIVGGESINEVKGDTRTNQRHPTSDENKATQDQQVATVNKDSLEKSNYNQSQKVFSFSLPFGGLSTIRSNFSKQLHSLKIDTHVSILNSHDRTKEEIRLRLQRHQSISTLDEAMYFKNYKGTDDVRFRAVKHSITTNLNEILPDFIYSKKGKEEWDSVYDQIEGNIVILGGYRGSILRDAKTHKRVWIPIKAGFHLRKINLLLGPSIEDELNASKYIYPDGVLKNIGPIDICKRLIKKLSNNPKTNVKEFGYDWRLSGELVSQQLVNFLSDIYKSTGKPTLVIAHSMGGLIAHSAMHKNPKLFRSIIYVGVPSECLNILGPIRFGDSVILSDKILTFETNFMMRSSFNFLPLSGRLFVNKYTNEHYDLDFFDPETWVEFNLNPLVAKKRKLQEELRTSSPSPQDTESNSSFPSINSISSKIKNYRTKTLNRKNKPSRLEQPISLNIQSLSSPDSLNAGSFSPTIMSPQSPYNTEEAIVNNSITFSEAYNYLSKTLKRTKKFILDLEFKEELANEYPPLAVVYGDKVPSVRGSNVTSLKDIKDGNYYEFFYGHGDGVVHQKWLMPENKGFRFYNHETGEGEIVGKFSSDCGHVNLMTDLKTIAHALSSVMEAEVFWEQKKKKNKNKNKN